MLEDQLETIPGLGLTRISDLAKPIFYLGPAAWSIIII
jgi:hypothetical protein